MIPSPLRRAISFDYTHSLQKKFRSGPDKDALSNNSLKLYSYDKENCKSS